MTQPSTPGRVWVTRDEPPAGPLSTALQALGLEAVLAPLVRRTLLNDAREDIESLRPTDWLVLTSPYAAEHAWLTAVPRVAAVGQATAEVARGRGFRVEFIAPGSNRATLFPNIPAGPEDVIFFPRSSLAPVPGGRVQSRVMYQTLPQRVDMHALGQIDIVAVTSASAARALGEVAWPVASIGPSTTAALRRPPVIECDEPSLPRLAGLIGQWLSTR